MSVDNLTNKIVHIKNTISSNLKKNYKPIKNIDIDLMWIQHYKF